MRRRKINEPQLDFESSIAEIEGIVSALENESLKLEQMISAYERGNSLLKSCESILKSARKRLEKIPNEKILQREESSENGLAFKTKLHDDPPTAIPPIDNDDTISLF